MMRGARGDPPFVEEIRRQQRLCHKSWELTSVAHVPKGKVTVVTREGHEDVRAW